MWGDLPLLPERASTLAREVDLLTACALVVSLVFAALVAVLIVVFAARYRRRASGPRARHVPESALLELSWSAVPLVVMLGLHAWGLDVYLDVKTTPERAERYFVVGKQWMWKFQHPDGRREINELHVPLGRPVELTMTSEDVIHSLFIPAFRVKSDVLPGRYSTLWFEATRPGRYDLRCAEYCGTQHSLMTGSVIVLEPQDYSAWLEGEDAGAPLSERGRRRFEALACGTCHGPDSGRRGPDLAGLHGREVRLRDGGTVVADDAYLRESVLDPTARVVAGYEAIMPTYRGQIDEEGLLELLAYLRSLEGSP